jgi:hypothetical protein
MCECCVAVADHISLHAPAIQKTYQSVFGARRDQQAQKHGQYGPAPPPVRAAFAATSISAQKIRFWKAIAVLVVACMCYIIYLNIYAFHGTVHRSSPEPSHLQPKASKPATTEAQPQQQKQQKHQKFRTSESPEKLKAVILKSIPHDTGAFTQVCTQPLSCIAPLLTRIAGRVCSTMMRMVSTSLNALACGDSRLFAVCAWLMVQLCNPGKFLIVAGSARAVFEPALE